MNTASFSSALLLTALAGIATTIGSAAAFVVKKPGGRFMGFTLGFSAGVMILISMVELLRSSIAAIGFLSANIAFLAGMSAFLLMDMLLPHDYIGHHDHAKGADKTGEASLKRAGLLLALGLGLHNFPEGMVTFVGALKDPKLGIAIAVAVAIHNIPEGLAVSVPIYAATGSRKKAFLWSFLSGVSEPVGAAMAGLVLMPFLTASVFGWTLAAVAGIMVAISLDELIPIAKAYDHEHAPIIGIMAGMAVMAGSLFLMYR